jgi:hypothetical protein
MQLFLGSADFLFFHSTNIPLKIEKHCTKVCKDLDFLFFCEVQIKPKKSMEKNDWEFFAVIFWGKKG